MDKRIFSRSMRPSGPTLREMGKPQAFPAKDEKRAVYNNLLKYYAGNSRVVLTEGFLRFEQLFTNSRLFTFPVLANEGTQRTSEQRLAPADAFHVDRVMFYLGARSTVAGVGQSAVQMETFGNTINLGANLSPFWTMYSGKLSVKVDSVDVIKQLDLIGFRYVGATQTGRIPATGGVDTASDWNSSEVWRQITPSFRLNGGSANEWTVTLPDLPGTITAPANTELVCGFICKGWLAQNGAAYNPRGN